MTARRGDTSLSQVMDRALRYLASRPRSQAQVRQHLLRRFPPETVASAIERLRDRGLLDDHAFARSWVQSRLTHRPRGAALIARELADQGVPTEAIEGALADTDDMAAARQAAQRILRHLQGSDYWEFRRKGWQFLHRRGFNSSIIRHALQHLWKEARGELPPEEGPGNAP